MSEELRERQNELSRLIEIHSLQNGALKSEIPSLSFIRYDRVSEPGYGVYNPSFCLITQGSKEVFLADERFEYGPSNYLITSMNVPVVGKLITASPDAPFLSIKLEFTHHEILEVLNQAPVRVRPKETAARALFVGQIESPLLDASLR